MKKLLLVTLTLLAATSMLAMPAKALTDHERLLGLINTYRASKNLAPLAGNESLKMVSQAHSANMHDKNDLNHVLDGKGPSDRLNDAGIAFTAMVENVAFNKGYQDPVQTCFEGWVNSPPHNANMLNPDVTDAGIGVAFSDSKGWWFTFLGIRPDGDQPQPKPEPDKIQSVELTMRQGTSMNYTLTFRNTGKTLLIIKASIPTGFGWLSIQPTTTSIEPGKAFNFQAKIIVPAPMPVGSHSGRILFEHVNGSSAWDFHLTVIENPNLPRPNFEVTCPKTATISFEPGAYAYISIVIKNTGNVDINPRATFSSSPADLVRMNPDSGFLTGKISKGAQFTAKIMMVMAKTTNLKSAFANLTLADQGITKTCKIELIPASPTSISIAGPQVVKLDFVGKTKTISYTATNTGPTKAILVPEVYYGANSCLVISFESTGRGIYIDPGKSITVKITLRLKCAPQVATIPGYLKISRVIGKEQTSKLHEFKLIK